MPDRQHYLSVRSAGELAEHADHATRTRVAGGLAFCSELLVYGTHHPRIIMVQLLVSMLFSGNRVPVLQLGCGSLGATSHAASQSEWSVSSQ